MTKIGVKNQMNFIISPEKICPTKGLRIETLLAGKIDKIIAPISPTSKTPNKIIWNQEPPRADLPTRKTEPRRERGAKKIIATIKARNKNTSVVS